MTEDPFALVVAHLFRRSGRDALSENEFANAASLDLRWFSPKDARALVAGLVRSGHLEREEDGRLKPAFAIGAVDVPLTFRPPADLHTKVPPAGSALPRHAPSTPSPSRPQAQPVTRPPAVSEKAPAPAAVDHTDAAPTTVPTILEAISSRTKEPVPVWVERMNRIVQECGDLVAPEAALLLAASRAGVDVAAWAPPVWDAFVAKRATRSR